MPKTDEIVLRAHGVLYSLEVEVEAGELDWLDRTILALAREPRVLGELTRCFGLPRRMVEDAVGRLIERQLLLLDVAHATVWTSGVVAEMPLRGLTDVLLVWQDHVTGMLFPWDLVKSLSRAPASEDQLASQATTLVLRGGPPVRTVLEMSDAEILAGLEGFGATPIWPERTSRRESVRRQSIFIRAQRTESGTVVPVDTIRWLLWRNWLTLGAIPDGEQIEAPPVALPAPWLNTVGRWAHGTAKRIQELQAGRVVTDNSDSAEALADLQSVLGADVQQVWWAAPSLRDDEGKLSRFSGRPLVVVSDRDGVVGAGRAFLRRSQAAAGGGDSLLVVCGATQRTLAEERDLLPDTNVVGHDRPDVEFVILDDRLLLVGVLQTGQVFSLALRSERPLLSYAAWASQGTPGIHNLARSSSGSGSELRFRVMSLENSLRELEVSLSSAGGYVAEHMPDACDHLTRELNNVASELNVLDVIPTKPLEADELLAAMRQAGGGRVLIRDADSPLADSIGDRFDVVVWSRTRPEGNGRFRWMAVAGPCEIVILGDVVVLGWWSCAGGGDVPPFLAMHSATLASELLNLSSRAAPLDSQPS